MLNYRSPSFVMQIGLRWIILNFQNNNFVPGMITEISLAPASGIAETTDQLQIVTVFLILSALTFV